MSEFLLSVRGVSKSFPGVKALEGVQIDIKKGEVHCLMGENGAGKSTLIKILAGAYEMDSGSVEIDGEPVDIENPHQVQSLGISFIFQELSVAEKLTVEENLTLGTEHHHFSFVNKRKNLERVRRILSDMNVDLDPNRPVESLTVSQKQMMLIAKALSFDARLIVMDEPTASLTDTEAEELFTMIDRYKEHGVSFLYVSHRFEDIFRVGDRITVFRDGKYVDTVDAWGTTQAAIIRMMVGRDLVDTFPTLDVDPGEEVLTVKGLVAQDLLKGVSFSLRKGEILGVAGLAGAGKSELARALFGDNPINGGEVLLSGEPIDLGHPRRAIRRHIGMIPEERRSQGILSLLSVRENISAAAPKRVSRFGVLKNKKDRELATSYIDRLRIKTPSAEQVIRFLSGGNQQKAVVAKWLAADSEVLLLDEPTRGIDVGAKAEIYQLIGELASAGKAIMFFSSELPELIGMCHRILVLREGRLMAELSGKDVTQEKIMEFAIGGNSVQETA